MATPALPIIPLEADGPRRIAPTDIAQFIRLEQCARYLRLRLHERRHGRGFLYGFGVAPQSIPPILTKSGAAFETTVEDQVATLTQASGPTRAVNCKDAARDDEAFQGADNNAAVVQAARDLPSGATLFLFQPRLRVTIGAWELRGDVDILRLHRDAAGALQVLIADMKSTTAAKVEHRLQVAFYHEMLAALFAAAGLPYAAIQTAILYRGPADGARLSPEEQQRHADQRAQAQALFGVGDALLELVPTPENYRAEVHDLVTGPQSVAARLAATDFAAVPYHLTYKCDGCLYNEFCMKWSAATDDLSLLPHLTDHEKNALRAAGVTTMQGLATLKEFRAPDSPDLLATPETTPLVRKLSATPRVGARLDELIHRARRYRRTRGDQLRALSSIPSKGYGSLPYTAPDHNPNLVRVFIDAQHDYLHDRIYLLGALVAGCEGGVEAPDRRRSVVHLTDGPPADPAQEQALFVAWITATLQAIAAVAAPDANGDPKAPIHLIFFNRFAQRLLLDGLARHFSAIAAATPLYDFVTQIAAFDSPLVSFLDQEVRELKNDPMVCQSLQALARARGFDWNTPEPFATIFRTRMFDDRGKLVEEAEGPEAWYTSRARFNSQIPLEYAYAAWGELPAPPARGHDDFATYRGATPALLQRFHARRLEAIAHVTRDFSGNRTTTKSTFDLSGLAAFAGKARTFADALAEFLALERHTVLSGWKTARLAPPERRVLAGETLTVRYHTADQRPELLEQLAENERRRELREAYVAALQATKPGAAAKNLPKKQQTETKQIEITHPYRLRIDLTDVDCDLAEVLALTTLRPGDQLILAPRWIADERLPEAERRPITPSAKRLLYSMRAKLRTIDATTGIVEVDLSTAGGQAKLPGYVFSTMGPFDRPPADGERLTLDPDPNDWHGAHLVEVVLGLQAGQPNTVYARLAHPTGEQGDWPAAAVAGQRHFMDGLDALHAAGRLHPFDANQRDFIVGHGEAPTLLVQGPPGTGKSYSTAFALLARLQGALAAGRPYRVLVSCKTHAATNVLLEKLVEVQRLLRAIRDTDPAAFDRHIDPRVLDVPILRIRPNDTGVPDGVAVLPRGDELNPLTAHAHVVAGATPGGIRGMLKDAGSLFGHDWCDGLVLDEASQMNLPEACMAGLALHPRGHLIVVGDHRQMPPIVAHGWADERRRTFQEYHAYESLFVTLRDRDPAPPMVKFAESFRLHQAMAAFLREEIYIHDGIPYHSRKTRVLDAHPHDDPFVAAVLAPDHPLIVVVHEEASSQQRNPFEQQLVAPILQALADPARHHLDHIDGLGVVVPHRAQRAALQEAVPQLAPRDPATGLIQRSAIDTVERFQGGERRAIVVSATESDRDYIRSAGEFLLDPRRLNVALSRAKEKLVLVAARSVFTVFNADEQTFANAQIWKNLLRRTCTVPLWEGQCDGTRVEVWGCAPQTSEQMG